MSDADTRRQKQKERDALIELALLKGERDRYRRALDEVMDEANSNLINPTFVMYEIAKQAREAK